jgi:hypothetical protein
MKGWMDGWMDGWIDGWMDGSRTGELLKCEGEARLNYTRIMSYTRNQISKQNKK